MGIFADNAIRFFESGYIPLPVHPKSKKCTIKNWNNIFNKDLTEDTLEAYCTSHGDWGIGLVCGQACDVVAVDLDWQGEHAKILENMVLGVLPPTPVVKTGKKLWTRFYRLSEGVKLQHFKRHGTDKVFIDIISDGPGYTVMPPSKYNDDINYRYLSDDSLLDVDKTDLPFLTLEQVAALKEIAEMPNETIHYNLKNPESRNDQLFGHFCFLFRSIKDEATLVSLLLKFDIARHTGHPKGPYYLDPKYARGDGEAQAKRDVAKWFEYKSRKTKESGKPAEVEALTGRVSFSTNKKGDILANADNAVRALQGLESLKQLFWYDEFYGRIRTDKDGTTREWRDTDDIALMLYMQNELGIGQMALTTIQNAVEHTAQLRKRNEPKDWFESLTWDGKERLPDFFVRGFGAEDTPYTRAVARNWWLGMLARIYEPGCKFDNMVVLEGGQGKFKSTALNVIGGDWFMESTEQIGTKDFLQSLNGKMLVEIAELDGFGKADVKTIKKTITCRVDTYRPSYGRRSIDHKRQCVFVGTTNEDEYLEDATGGRRFWPISIGEIDLNYIEAQRTNLFAEASYKFKRGDTWWEMPETAKDVQSSRNRHDAWEDLILEWLTGREGSVRISDVLIGALHFDVSKIETRGQNRVGKIMKQLGWTNHRVRGQTGRVIEWTRGDMAKPYDATRSIIPNNVSPFRR